MALMKTTITLFILSAAAILLPTCHKPHADTVCSCKCSCEEPSTASKPAHTDASNTNSPTADEQDTEESKRLKLPYIFSKMKKRNRFWPEDTSNMKTGDKCGGSGSHCTGGPSDGSDRTEENEPTGREICCTNNVINATNSIRIETDPPRKKAKWKNCAALEDGRNGEKCEGSFACFKKVTDKHCLERVACGESLFGEDKLLRYLICDDVSSSPSSVAAPNIYTNCADARGAKPLDRCTGEFLCEVTGGLDTPMREIPPCDRQKGFCPTKWEDKWISILYCDGETIHIYNFGSRV